MDLNAMSMKFTLITGASAGIGKELAIVCAGKGFNLLLVSLPHSGLAGFAEELRGHYHVTVHYLEIDLTGPSAPQAVFQWCISKDYEIDKLINNVGTGGNRRFEHFQLSEIQSMIQLNTYVVSSITNLFIPMLKKQEKAYILNVSSTASFFNIPNKVVYAATKAFINTLTTSLRNELADTNISVSVMCPGGSAHRRDANVRISKALSGIVHEKPEFIAKAGIAGMLKEKRMILPGFIAKLYVFTSKLIPVSIADSVVRKLFKSPAEKQIRHISGNGMLSYWSKTVAVCLLLILLSVLYFQPDVPDDRAGSKRQKGNHQAIYLKNNPSISAYTVFNDKMAYIVNDDNHLYLYNPKQRNLEAKIPFNDKGVFKGLAYSDGSFYLLRSDGYILTIQEKSANDCAIVAYDLPLNESDNLEGLYVDPINNRLLIDVQAKNLEDNDRNGMYGFDLGSKAFINAGPVFFFQ
jgi:short-subunit dehydrogenase